MTETSEFDIGRQVTCRDGVCGTLRRVVVDPSARVVTHLVVAPRHKGRGRLVPVERAAATGHDIRLNCTTAEFAQFEEAEEEEVVPSSSGHAGYDAADVLDVPAYGLSLGGHGADLLATGAAIPGLATSKVITEDRVPPGEVEIRRGDRVHANDGPIGHVKGVVTDEDHQITHLVLDEGHLWDQKTVAIPVSAVTRVSDGVWVSLAKREIEALAPPLLPPERPRRVAHADQLRRNPADD